MNIGGIDLNVGDTVNYIRYNERNSFSKPRTREGKIIHMTDTIVTVDLGKYRDSFSLQDLACGTVEIPGMAEIILTTSEIHEPYRVRDEMTRDTYYITEGGRRMRQPIPRPPEEELAKVYNDGDRNVRVVQDFYKISKTTARKWLKEAGLLTVKPRQTKETASEIPEETKTAVNMRLPNGQINWTEVWPIVEAELAKGRDKYEIAAELGIGRNAMKNKVQKMAGQKPKEAKLVVSDLEKMQTIAELMAYKEHLTAERKLVDLVLRFVDIALKEKEGVSESA
jgi:hypothetical protein